VESIIYESVHKQGFLLIAFDLGYGLAMLLTWIFSKGFGF